MLYVKLLEAERGLDIGGRGDLRSEEKLVLARVAAVRVSVAKCSQDEAPDRGLCNSEGWNRSSLGWDKSVPQATLVIRLVSCFLRRRSRKTELSRVLGRGMFVARVRRGVGGFGACKESKEKMR